MKLVAGVPAWFPMVFAHLAPAEFAIVSRLWAEEPALRTLALMLDELHPDRCKRRGCPHCGHAALNWRIGPGGQSRAKCPACRRAPVSTVGTPFYRIQQKNWHALYGTLFVLWGPWTKTAARLVAGCTDSKQFADFQRRLAPLVEELKDTMPLASRPAFRLGLSPADQGVRCLRCQGTDLHYRKRHDSENPTFLCRTCSYHFQLEASRRHLLPLDADVCCPDCGSRALNRSHIDAHARQHYRCRDCKRCFVEQPRKPHLSRRMLMRSKANCGGIGVP